MIEVDDSQFPVVVVRYIGQYTDDEFVDYLRQMDALLAKPRGQYALLLDASQARMPTGRQARLQANWMRDNQAQIRQRTLAIAFVISSPAVRGVLEAILALQSMPAPYRVEPTAADAEAWLRERLAAAPLSG